MSIIEAESLSKVFYIPQKDPGVAGAVKALFRPRFQPKVAVDDVSFKVDAGEVVGYIGVNGAGKSTTIKMLTGILVPSGGQVRVLGRDPHRERVANAHDIGVVFGQRTQLWWDLALTESLGMVARVYDVPPARYRQLLDQFAEILELKDLLHVPIRTMSLGQKMRAAPEVEAEVDDARGQPAGPERAVGGLLRRLEARALGGDHGVVVPLDAGIEEVR